MFVYFFTYLCIHLFIDMLCMYLWVNGIIIWCRLESLTTHWKTQTKDTTNQSSENLNPPLPKCPSESCPRRTSRRKTFSCWRFCKTEAWESDRWGQAQSDPWGSPWSHDLDDDWGSPPTFEETPRVNSSCGIEHNKINRKGMWCMYDDIMD